MQYSKFHPAKNDICFAFVMAAVFVVTIVGAVAGTMDQARGPVIATPADTEATSVAFRSTGEQEPEAAHAGRIR